MAALLVLSTLLASVLATSHPSPFSLVHGRRSSPSKAVAYGTDALSNRDAANIVYDNVWAGAVLEDANGTFTSVTGTFTVPTPTGSGSSAIWVGIDGIGCQVILQTGVDATITNGSISYSSWYEWFPNPSHTFPASTISFSPNDTIRLTATAHTPTTGTVTIANLSRNQTATSPVNSTTPLCQRNAEWIVEDYEADGIVAFDDFGTVRFEAAQATVANGTTARPDEETTLYAIRQNGTTLATASVVDGVVVVKHT